MSTARPAFGLSSASRTLSSQALKDTLSKIAMPPINPVAALQQHVECVIARASLHPAR